MSFNRRTVIATGAAAAGLAFASQASAATVQVNIPRTSNKFDPETLTIKKGDTVEWRNRQIYKHSITCDPAKAKKPESTALPSGAKAFDSGMLSQDQTFKQRFTVAGTYKYFCIEHESMGMIGTVIVA